MEVNVAVAAVAKVTEVTVLMVTAVMVMKKNRTSQSLPSCFYSLQSNFAHANCVRSNFARTNGRFK